MTALITTITPPFVDSDNDSDNDCHCASEEDPSHSTLKTVAIEESDSDDDENDDIRSTRSRVITVRFSSKIKTRIVASHDSYSEKEVQRCWYSPEEKEKLAAKREKVILRMEAKKPERKSRPYRGLEHWTEEGSDRVTAHIDRVFNAVMDEQDDQWAKQIDDYDRLADISRSVSAESVEQALANAYRDEQEAMKIAMQDGDDCTVFTAGTDMTPVGPRKNRTRVTARPKRTGRRKAKETGKKETKKVTTKKDTKKEGKKEKSQKPKNDPPGETATGKVAKKSSSTKTKKSADKAKKRSTKA